MKKEKRLQIANVEYHRNGVCGEGFHVIRFFDPNLEDKGILFGIYFNRHYYCVIDPQDASLHFRGDHYADRLRGAAERYQAELSRKLGLA